MSKKTDVAIVDQAGGPRPALNEAIRLIGGLDDLNKRGRNVVLKVGIFDHRSLAHTTVDVAGAITAAFDASKKVYIVESDNYKGTGSERLRIWDGLVGKKVSCFNLSEDAETKDVEIAGERVPLSHILFKPSVLVSTHILRSFDKGSILKNLLGLVPDRRKARFHKSLDAALMDMYEAVGGIDLAVVDATYAYKGTGANAHARPDDTKNRFRTDMLIVGRDAVAVEAVAAELAGLDIAKMGILREAARRRIGETDLTRIKIRGMTLEEARKRVPKRL